MVGTTARRSNEDNRGAIHCAGKGQTCSVSRRGKTHRFHCVGGEEITQKEANIIKQVEVEKASSQSFVTTRKRKKKS
jgi:hypothetical protein